MFRIQRSRHIEIEKRTVAAMITIYCRGHNHEIPCSSCIKIRDYALKRLERCPFGEDKPSCKTCPVHCYSPAMRENIKTVMRYAGPRMIWKHPLLATRYKLNQLFYKPKS
ncbi:MAG: nitrous oxide-stimulated promoter family protein [Bacteroidales bacterium]|jgi:hypothetical protein|nr:nitrous oxide-stimulated promoter family protein [Bacteroidales bacterium]